MKKLLYLTPLFLELALSSCYKDDIRDLQKQINKIKGTHIASLQEQMNAIKTTLPQLEQTEKVLEGYIENLKTTATNLQQSINEMNAVMMPKAALLDLDN
jgi:chromosome segregation ATPase